MGATVNLTHHFLIAMPSMADPEFRPHADVRVRAQRRTARWGGGEPAHRHDAVRALRADRGAAADNRLREAPVMFGGPVQVDRGFVLHRPLGNWQSTLAISDEHRPHHVQGHPRGGRPRRRAAEPCWSRWAMQVGRRASSSRSSPRTPGSPSRPIPDVLFGVAGRATAARGHAAPRHRPAAAVRTTPGTPDWLRPTRHRPRPPCSPSTSGRAASAWRSATRWCASRIRSSTIDDERSAERFAAIAALVDEWQPRHAGRRTSGARRRHAARDDRAGASLRAAAAWTPRPPRGGGRRALDDAGRAGRARRGGRGGRRGRAVRDAIAAQAILQGCFDDAGQR